MTEVITINSRGTLTLPKQLRTRLGLKDGGQVIAEATDEGILLRLGATFPIEIYSEERLKEFKRANEDSLPRFRIKKKRK